MEKIFQAHIHRQSKPGDYNVKHFIGSQHLLCLMHRMVSLARRIFRWIPISKFDSAACADRLFVENLEPRQLLTTYVVDTVVDDISTDGLVSLREAILAANQNVAVGDAAAGDVDGDRIEFSQALAGLTITLSGQALVVSDDLEIQGNSNALITLDANSQSQIFILQDGDFAASHLRLINGVRLGVSDFTGGGAIFAVGRALALQITAVEFENCITDGNGGAIYSVRKNTQIDDCLFRNCTAVCGGGVFFASSSMVAATIRRSFFESNTASYHGGGAWVGLFDAETIVDDCVFVSNQAIAGAGIYAVDRGSHLPLLRILNSQFTDNNASRRGGGVFSESVRMLIRNSHFTRNLAIDNADINRGDGGALFLSAANAVHIVDSRFIGNNADRNGGGIFADKDRTLAVHNSFFSGNAARGRSRGNGGGALFSTGAVLRIFSGTFDRNFAHGPAGGGAAILARGGFLVTRFGTEFVNNQAGRTGGAIDLVNSDALLDNAVFGSATQRYDGNRVDSVFPLPNENGLGGAISIRSIGQQNNIVTMSDCRFFDNVAFNGGAIYVGLYSTVRFVNGPSLFEFNGASRRGGAIFNAGVIDFHKSVSFYGNIAQINGGGIFNAQLGQIQNLELAEFDNNSPNDVHGA